MHGGSPPPSTSGGPEAVDGDAAAVGNGFNAGERLLATAARLFRAKGYGRSTTRELAELLGIQKASLYHHIDAKEDLLFAICLESLRRITEAVSAVATQADPSARLRAVMEAHVKSAVNDRDLHTTMLIELPALSPERRSEIVEARGRYERLLQEVIAEDQRSGRLRPDLDARHLTLALLNMLNWTIFWFDTDGDLPADDLGRMLGSIFLEGAAEPAAR